MDAQGYVYVAGRAGRGFPTSAAAFQPTFQGYNGGGYGGYQNAFVAKLSPDGWTLIWASYVGVAQLCRDIAIDERGDIYLPLGYPNQGALPPTEWFSNAFQKTPNGLMHEVRLYKRALSTQEIAEICGEAAPARPPGR